MSSWLGLSPYLSTIEIYKALERKRESVRNEAGPLDGAQLWSPTADKNIQTMEWIELLQPHLFSS